MAVGFHEHNKTKKQLGLSLLEALVATAIVGIGFIAIFQMTKYSIESIAVSSDRTKATYLVEMVAEDLIANRHAKYDGNFKFAEHLSKASNVWKINSCKKGPRSKAEVSSLYEVEEENAPKNKIRKWNQIFASDKHLKCRKRKATATDTTLLTAAPTPTKDTKLLKIITICDSGCDYVKSGTHDKMYFGRMQVNMNDGRKRKFLYFQAHYELEE